MAMGSVFDCGSESGTQQLLEHLGRMRLAGKRPRVEVLPEKRSLDQNAMIHGLYKQIATQLEGETVLTITRECKLRFGVPILRAASPKFSSLYDKVIKAHDYETKLQMMDYLPVTSLFTKAQGTEYIDTVIQEYTRRGCSLLSPSEQEAYSA